MSDIQWTNETWNFIKGCSRDAIELDEAVGERVLARVQPRGVLFEGGHAEQGPGALRSRHLDQPVFARGQPPHRDAHQLLHLENRLVEVERGIEVAVRGERAAAAVLVAAAGRLPALIGHDIPSQIVKAGRRLDLHPRPADFDAIRQRALARDAQA